MEAEIGACPNRDGAQIQNRRDPYCPTLAQFFGAPDPALRR